MKTTLPAESAHRSLTGPRSQRDRRLDRIDTSAAWLIKLGGFSIVLSVVAIIVFIGVEALPLLGGVHASPVPALSRLESVTPTLVLADEYLETAAVIGSDGSLYTLFFDSSELAVDPVSLTQTVSCAAASQDQRLLALGSPEGSCLFLNWRWRVSYDAGRHIKPEWELLRSARFFDSVAVHMVRVTRRESGHIAALALSLDGQVLLYTYDPEWESETTYPIPVPAGSKVTTLALSPAGDLAVLGFGNGHILVARCRPDGTAEVIQSTRATDGAVTAVSFLLGGQSLIIGDASGGLARWLAVSGDGERQKSFRRINTFDEARAGIQGLLPSPRDKGFVAWDSTGTWSLSHATTGRTNLHVSSQGEPALLLAYAPRGDGMLAGLASGRVVCWHLDNPHPEATMATLFGKVWYEGFDKPEFIWQSTGGTDAFEPKLSLWPLMFGTLKGTLYAMLFSVPVSILAAIYVSQLARPGFRSVVKPAIELMAALPSVVVGFLAALWLAPMIERHLIAGMLILFAVPLFAVMAAPVWQLVPARLRERLPEGIEPAVSLPFVLLGVACALLAAPILESAWFAGDVRQWLYVEQGIRFDPRNNIVVGIALGVAVIPIIFTMSEDALSNVPPSLVSGALALGASRWQATWRIVLRAASPGIFAAVMLGLGRAVGETMIVLMATGNTPILDWSIFNGMRTMSAAIAVEIPEAPQGGTLYRVLFLTAFLLFLFTLAVNTAASLVSAHLRRRYGRF